MQLHCPEIQGQLSDV